VAASNGELIAALGRFDTASVASQPGRLVVSVSQKDKLRFLAGLHEHMALIRDTRIEEPSLEEVLLATS